jgi:NtrC-family two-component system sensor histidine kinase KinB
MKKIVSFLGLKEARPVIFLGILAIIQAVVFFAFFPVFAAAILSVVWAAVFVWVFQTAYQLARANRALTFERNQNTHIVDSLSEGVIVYNQDFKIVSFSQAAEIITGVRKQEIIGKTIAPEWAVNERFRLVTQIMFPSLAPVVIKKTSATYPQVVKIKFTEPHELYLEITTTQVLGNAGELIGFIKVIRDKSREIQLLKTKSEFITVAAHQLRTPLVGIKWALELLAKNEIGELNDQQQTTVRDAYSTAQRLGKMVDDLLDVAKIEEGRFGYQFEKNDLVTLVQEILESHADEAVRYRVKILFFKPGESIPLLTFDKSRIAVVVHNLVENALRYNVENGELRVKIEKLADKPYIQVSVEDTGVGIPQNDLPRLFQKFFRAGNVLKKETEGSGLGLYISRNIIKRHGGEIWAESTEKRGSTFYFVLPLDEKMIPPTEMVAEEGF